MNAKRLVAALEAYSISGRKPSVVGADAVNGAWDNDFIEGPAQSTFRPRLQQHQPPTLQRGSVTWSVAFSPPSSAGAPSASAATKRR